MITRWVRAGHSCTPPGCQARQGRHQTRSEDQPTGSFKDCRRDHAAISVAVGETGAWCRSAGSNQSSMTATAAGGPDPVIDRPALQQDRHQQNGAAMLQRQVIRSVGASDGASGSPIAECGRPRELEMAIIGACRAEDGVFEIVERARRRPRPAHVLPVSNASISAYWMGHTSAPTPGSPHRLPWGFRRRSAAPVCAVRWCAGAVAGHRMATPRRGTAAKRSGSQRLSTPEPDDERSQRWRAQLAG